MSDKIIITPSESFRATKDNMNITTQFTESGKIAKSPKPKKKQGKRQNYVEPPSVQFFQTKLSHLQLRPQSSKLAFSRETYSRREEGLSSYVDRSVSDLMYSRQRSNTRQ